MDSIKVERVKAPELVGYAYEYADVVIFSGDGSPEDVERVCEAARLAPLGGYFGLHRDLTAMPTPNGSVGASAAAHPPHTDACYANEVPTDIILQCLAPDRRGGGVGLFSPVENMFRTMPPNFFECLSSFPVIYRRMREDGQTIDSYEGTIISLTTYNEKPTIRWRDDLSVWPCLAFDASPAEAALFARAIAYVHNHFETTERAEVTYRQGDIVLFSNRYLVHGRTRILDPSRAMRRIWLQADNNSESVMIKCNK